MRGWNGLGVTDTIYEEEQAEDEGSKCSSSGPSPTPPSPTSCTHSSSSSSSSSSLMASLQRTVEEWSRTTGSKAEVSVRVYDHIFHLHEEPLVSHSRYLRRHVAESSPSIVTISPPSGITPEIFAAVASFCYGADASITPYNVAALRIAAEWLDMDDDDDDDNPKLEGDGSLLERTEWYFCQTVASSAEHAGVVLRTCLGLLSDAARSAAFLAARCIEALIVAGGGGTELGNSVWLDDVLTTKTEEFQMIADAIHDRLEHDLVYNIVDHYLEKNFEGKRLTEEEKNRICSVVDCKKLSRTQLVHLVRNPRMPLRFVVQAMLVEQFHTRVSFYDRVCKTHVTSTPSDIGAVTLGDILQRDAATRQAQNLKENMEATYLRIQMLEQELSDMRGRLREEGKHKVNGETESVRIRSESCRFFAEAEKEEEEEQETVIVGMERNSKSGRWLGRRLIRGFWSVLAAMRSESRSTSCSGASDFVGSATAKESKTTTRTRTHRRNRSFS